MNKGSRVAAESTEGATLRMALGNWARGAGEPGPRRWGTGPAAQNRKSSSHISAGTALKFHY